MKQRMSLLFCMLGICAAPWSHASTKDQRAIIGMAGCFEVTFAFKETDVFRPDYGVRSKDYLEHGLEWVEVDSKSKKEIHLQHVLVIGDQSLKHWGQRWQLNPSKQIVYLGNNTWENRELVRSEFDAASAWMQTVVQVDDAPRYSCMAPWIHSKKFSTWRCGNTPSPLPRREFSQRSDYNLLMRGNQHTVGKRGWYHDQENDKFQLQNKTYQWIAKERGRNTYKKVSSKRCQVAKNWWKEHRKNWHVVQSVWEEVFEHHPKITFLSKVNDKTLWMELFALDEKYSQLPGDEYTAAKLRKEVHDKIHEFMK